MVRGTRHVSIPSARLEQPSTLMARRTATISFMKDLTVPFTFPTRDGDEEANHNDFDWEGLVGGIVGGAVGAGLGGPGVVLGGPGFVPVPVPDPVYVPVPEVGYVTSPAATVTPVDALAPLAPTASASAGSGNLPGDSGPALTRQTARRLQIKNNTGEKLTIHLQYRAVELAGRVAVAAQRPPPRLRKPSRSNWRPGRKLAWRAKAGLIQGQPCASVG